MCTKSHRVLHDVIPLLRAVQEAAGAQDCSAEAAAAAAILGGVDVLLLGDRYSDTCSTVQTSQNNQSLSLSLSPCMRFILIPLLLALVQFAATAGTVQTAAAQLLMPSALLSHIQDECQGCAGCRSCRSAARDDHIRDY